MKIIPLQLKLYNSLKGEKEIFEPLQEGYVGMYICGPTVYNEVHLGNCRTYVSFDVVRRYLKHLGFKVRYVRNITDVGHLENDADQGEDKIGKMAKLEQLEPMEIAHRYTLSFREMMSLLNNQPPDIEPTATGHILEQIQMIQQIIDNGFAYESNGSVYFDVLKYHSETELYGKLSGRNIEELFALTREDLEGSSEKRNPQDFALWKKASDTHIMRWDAPWSRGFPGWHLECSAMGQKYLGEQFDIHGGGMDLKFPHHECEVAQSVACQKKESVKYWMHANMLTINGEKMSKSKGNSILPREIFIGTSTVLKGKFTPEVLRFYMLQSHYRGVMNITQEGIDGAEKGFYKLVQAYLKLQKMDTSAETKSSFEVDIWEGKCYAAMNDDFNTPRLIAELFEAVKFINSYETKLPIGRKDLDNFKKIFHTFITDILGLKIVQKNNQVEVLNQVLDLILEIREGARVDKNWGLSDLIRDKLNDCGIKIKDEKEGTFYEY